MHVKNILLGSCLLALVTLGLTLLYVPEAFAFSTCPLPGQDLIPGVDSDDNFRKALDFAAAYWARLIKFMIHLVCTGLKAINIPCG
ncbi:hypothetical protein OAO01_00365 [Oligoflexia bacterium]|nr:hypothetical protein [Oligoflexia bacterium]